jgi:hypothetical protein
MSSHWIVKVLPLLLAAWIAGCSVPPGRPPADVDVPYRLVLAPFEIPGLPGLHSGAHAVHDGKLVILAGRTNGLHEFPPQRQAGLIWSFPPQKANNRVYVVDLAARRLVGSAPVDDLPARVALQLRATNLQSFRRDGYLYLVGGYGVTADGQSMRTFDQVLAIDLAALIETVQAGGRLDAEFARQHIHAGDHPALQVTGGGIEQLGDKVLLVFGQMFNGLYTTEGGVAQQEYSQAVRVFQLSLSDQVEDGLPSVDVKYLGKCPDPPATDPQPTPEGPYHRRDYPLVRVLAPDGTPRIGAFGGVFKGGRLEGYLHPVFITPSDDTVSCVDKGPKLGFTLAEATDSSQWLSQYESVIVPVYSAARKAMYTTSFGGISQYYWDPASRTLRRDQADFTKEPPVDGLPFIDSISTLRIGGAGNADFLHAGESFPPAGGEPECGPAGEGAPVKAPYLGTNSWFVMEEGLPLDNGVILLDRLAQPTEIGYIFGGIASTLPYPGNATCASSRVYAVTLDPRSASRTVKLAAPQL